MRLNTTLTLAAAALALAVALPAQAQKTLLNVSYDVAREYYKDYKRQRMPARPRRHVPWPTVWKPTW